MHRAFLLTMLCTRKIAPKSFAVVGIVAASAAPKENRGRRPDVFPVSSTEARQDAPLFLADALWDTKYKCGICRLTYGGVQKRPAPITSILLPLFVIFSFSNQFDNWHNVYQTFIC
jgi:hypothetical protein